jgi:hypothetical protein
MLIVYNTKSPQHSTRFFSQHSVSAWQTGVSMDLTRLSHDDHPASAAAGVQVFQGERRRWLPHQQLSPNDRESFAQLKGIASSFVGHDCAPM